MSSEILPLFDRWLGAALNGVLQGTLLAVLVFFLLKLNRRLNAATRHAVLFATLVLAALLPVAHLAGQTRLRAGTPSAAIPEGAPTAAIAEPAIEPSSLETTAFAFPIAREAEPVAAPKEDAVETFTAEEEYTELQVTEDGELPAGTEFAEPERQPSIQSAEDFLRGSLEVLRNQLRTAQVWQVRTVPLLSAAILVLWVLFALLRLGRILWECGLLRRYKRTATPAPEETAALFSTLRAEMRMRRMPRLLITAKGAAPLAAGFRHPAVFIPQSVADSVNFGELEHILRHELAHIARRDDWSNLLQQIVKAIFFFHPGVLWLCRRLTVEREIACDDHVLKASRSRRAYALFLTEFAGQAVGRGLIAAPAGWSNSSQLKERVSMILNSNRNASPRLAAARAGTLTIAALLVAILGFQSTPRLAFAQDESGNSASNDALSAAVDPAQSLQSGNAGSNSTDEHSISVGTTAAVAGLAGSADETGPRLKPGVAIVSTPARIAISAPAVAPAASIHPLPTPAPAPAAAPRTIVLTAPRVDLPPAALIVAHADAPPAQPGPRKVGDREEDSIEGRLARLERLVESLVDDTRHKEKDKDKRKEKPVSGMPPEVERAKQRAEAEVEKARMHAKAEHDRAMQMAMRDVKRAQEQAMREAKRAREEAKRAQEHAMREVKRAQEQAKSETDGKLLEQLTPLRPGGSQGEIERRREALELRRRSLEAEINSLEQQIENLEEEQERIEEEQEEHHDDHDDEGHDHAGSKEDGGPKVKQKF